MSDNGIVLLGGMHRSGTSALARVWNLLGAKLPEPLVPAGVGNELGHWEPAEVVAMNDRALLSADSDVNSALPLSADWFSSEVGETFADAVSDFVRPHLHHHLTLIKDPRISPLARAWRDGVERLGARPRFIIALRDPWEVAQSLASRQLQHFPDEVWPLERVAAIWLNYVLSIEEASRGAPRTFVDYSWLLSDWRSEVERMTAQLDVVLDEITPERAAAVDAFLDPEARRARRADHRLRGDRLLGAAYELFKSQREGGGRDDAAFDALRTDLSTAASILGGYVKGLEDRASDIGTLRSEARFAEQEAQRQRELTDAAERRVLHLSRLRTLDERQATSEASPAAGEAERLRRRLDALTAAHQDVVAEAKRERAAMLQEAAERLEAERDAHRDALAEVERHGAELLQAAAERLEAERDARLEAGARASSTLQEVTRSKDEEAARIQETADAASAGDRLVAEGLQEDARLSVEAAREEARILKRLRRSLAKALGRDPTEESNTDTVLTAAVRALGKTAASRAESLREAQALVQTQHDELLASAQVYEQLRQETVRIRERVAAAEAEAEAFARTVQDEVGLFVSAAQAAHVQSAEVEADLRRREEDVASERRDYDRTREELQHIYASRTWRTARRIASPLHPAVSLARRIARPLLRRP